MWQTRLGNTVQGYPVSFSLDGKQYIAVASGLGGGSPQQKPTMLLDEIHRPATGHQLYVFGLPDLNHLTRIAHIATAAGARTSLFVPDQGRLYVAVPHRGSQKAEVRVYEARN